MWIISRIDDELRVHLVIIGISSKGIRGKDNWVDLGDWEIERELSEIKLSFRRILIKQFEIGEIVGRVR